MGEKVHRYIHLLSTRGTTQILFILNLSYLSVYERLLPHIVEHVHNAVVYGERDRHVKDHSAEARHRALVEG